MKPSELAKAMAEAGAPMDAILIALRAIEDRDEVIENKRAVERERKRRQRAKPDSVPASVPGLSRDCPKDIPAQSPLSPSPLPSPHTPQLTPRPHTPPDNNTRTRKGAGPERPETVPEAVWRDFLALRKRKRADLTETALDAIRREAEKAGWSLADAMTEMVSRGWQGLKADWLPETKPMEVASDPILARLRAVRSHQAAAVPP